MNLMLKCAYFKRDKEDDLADFGLNNLHFTCLFIKVLYILYRTQNIQHVLISNMQIAERGFSSIMPREFFYGVTG